MTTRVAKNNWNYPLISTKKDFQEKMKRAYSKCSAETVAIQFLLNSKSVQVRHKNKTLKRIRNVEKTVDM